MKNLLICTFLVIAGSSLVYGASDTRIVDGKPQLAISRVNGIPAFTQQEQNDLSNSFSRFSATTPVIVEMIVRTQFETNLATSGITFKSFTEYQDCVNAPSNLQDKIDDLQPSQTRKLQSSVDYLNSENKKRDPNSSK